MKRYYFDTNASAPQAQGLADQLHSWLLQGYGNPSSVSQEGQHARSALEEARTQLKVFLGAPDASKLVFTSGATEANQLVLLSACAHRGTRHKMILSSVEHASVYQNARELEKQGIELVWIPVSAQGIIDVAAFQKQLSADVFLASVMLANNETGFIFPVKELASMARQQGVVFHTDAVCAVGKVPVDFQSLGVDYLTFSGHKFGALMGVGGVLARPDVSWQAHLVGGLQEQGHRAGTENLFGILSCAYALKQSLTALPQEMQRQQMLKAKLLQGIVSSDPAAVITQAETHLPQTISVSFPGLDGKLIVTSLDLEGVAVSSGSACSSGALTPSVVMQHLYTDPDVVKGSIRVSFGRNTTREHCEFFSDTLLRVITRLRGEA